MSARPRKTGRKDLPDNLYCEHDKRRGKHYFKYIRPDLPAGSKKRICGMGTDKATAVDAANQLNAILSKPSNLVSRALGRDKSFSDILTEYQDEYLPTRTIKGKPLSSRTLTEINRRIKLFHGHFGKHQAREITLDQFNDYFNTMTSSEEHNKHRQLLLKIYTWGMSKGYLDENIPDMTLKMDSQAKQRQRLDMAGYQAIFEHASKLGKLAMELALNTMQRREDLRQWKFSDSKDDFVYLIISKTRKHGKSAFIRIPLELPLIHSNYGYHTLRELIKACRDQVHCPYLLHQKPKNYRKSKEKDHWGQLAPRDLSDLFAEAREASGHYSHLKPAEKPTLHEIIALGEYLRKESGWSIKQIQTLRGHTQEKTTLLYLEGHDWTTVEIPKCQ